MLRNIADSPGCVVRWRSIINNLVPLPKNLWAFSLANFPLLFDFGFSGDQNTFSAFLLVDTASLTASKFWVPVCRCRPVWVFRTGITAQSASQSFDSWKLSSCSLRRSFHSRNFTSEIWHRIIVRRKILFVLKFIIIKKLQCLSSTHGSVQRRKWKILNFESRKRLTRLFSVPLST